MLKSRVACIFCLVFLTACNDDQDKALEELYKNQRVWESLNEVDYQMEFQYLAYSDSVGNYTIYVEQENVQTALYSGFNDEFSEYRQPDNFIFELATVANLFEIAEDAIANAAEYEITYDSEFGYPTTIVVDYVANIADDEFTYNVLELFRGSDISCTDEALPGISLTLSLESNTVDTDLCEAEVYIEEGEYVEYLDACFNNTFSGAWERPGTYNITASYPGYATQSLDAITAYPFICHVGTRNVEMEMLESTP